MTFGAQIRKHANPTMKKVGRRRSGIASPFDQISTKADPAVSNIAIQNIPNAARSIIVDITIGTSR